MKKSQNLSVAALARTVAAFAITLLVGMTSAAAVAQSVEGTVAGHELRLESAEQDLVNVQAQAACLSARYGELEAIMAEAPSAARVLKLERWRIAAQREMKALGLRIDGLETKVATAQAGLDAQGGLLTLVKTTLDGLTPRVEALEASVAELKAADTAVAARVDRVEERLTFAEAQLNVKQDRIRFGLTGAVWTLGVGAAVSLEIPLVKGWSIEGVVGFGKGFEGMASVAQVVAVRSWTVKDVHELGLRLGVMWASDSLVEGTRAFCEKQLGATIGFEYQWKAMFLAVDLGAGWDAPLQNGVVVDRFGFLGVLRFGAKF